MFVPFKRLRAADGGKDSGPTAEPAESPLTGTAAAIVVEAEHIAMVVASKGRTCIIKRFLTNAILSECGRIRFRSTSAGCNTSVTFSVDE